MHPVGVVVVAKFPN